MLPIMLHCVPLPELSCAGNSSAQGSVVTHRVLVLQGSLKVKLLLLCECLIQEEKNMAGVRFVLTNHILCVRTGHTMLFINSQRART